MPSNAAAGDCGTGRVLTLRADHSAIVGQTSGRWALTAERLHIIGDPPLDLDGPIIAADALSFSVGDKDGGSRTLSFRRCSSSDIAPPREALPDLIPPAPNAPD